MNLIILFDSTISHILEHWQKRAKFIAVPLTRSKRFAIASSSSFRNISKKSRCLKTERWKCFPLFYCEYCVPRWRHIKTLTESTIVYWQYHNITQPCCSDLTCPVWRFHEPAVCQWLVGCPEAGTRSADGYGTPGWSERTNINIDSFQWNVNLHSR